MKFSLLPRANKATSVNINLMPKDPFFETGIGRALKWALSVGRYIVIFTELVVIISFATRFSLDRQITDLNDSIHQKESIVRSYGELEQNVRSVQTVLEQYQQIQQQANITEIFPAMSQITPLDINLEEMVITPTSVAFSGNTLSQSSLNLLINNIQLSDKFFNVSVDRIETNAGKSAGFNFRIKADTQDARRQPAQRPPTSRTSGAATTGGAN